MNTKISTIESINDYIFKLGPRRNLECKNLDGANLDGANLDGKNLEGSNLEFYN